MLRYKFSELTFPGVVDMAFVVSYLELMQRRHWNIRTKLLSDFHSLSRLLSSFPALSYCWIQVIKHFCDKDSQKYTILQNKEVALTQIFKCNVIAQRGLLYELLNICRTVIMSWVRSWEGEDLNLSVVWLGFESSKALAAQSRLTLCDPRDCSQAPLSTEFSRQDYCSG